MADPALISCTQGEWTLIAENVISGYVRKPLAESNYDYFWTSRDTGGAAPSDSDETDGNLAVKLFENNDEEPISSITPQDFYVWITNATPADGSIGKIRVDLGA